MDTVKEAEDVLVGSKRRDIMMVAWMRMCLGSKVGEGCGLDLLVGIVGVVML